MQTATLPMKIFSKVLQIKEIWVKKSAGNISLVSWVINIYTCLSKCFFVKERVTFSMKNSKFFMSQRSIYLAKL